MAVFVKRSAKIAGKMRFPKRSGKKLNVLLVLVVGFVFCRRLAAYNLDYGVNYQFWVRIYEPVVGKNGRFDMFSYIQQLTTNNQRRLDARAPELIPA
jgi:hypothetical protein